jgi:hypothetical protein
VTTLAERIPLDEISRQAEQARPGRAVLTVIAAVFFALGWTAGRFFLALAWCAVAVRLGWQAGAARGGPARTDR